MVSTNSTGKRNSAKAKKKAAKADSANLPNTAEEAVPELAVPANATTAASKVLLQEQVDTKVEVAPIVSVRRAARAIDDKVEKDTEEPMLPEEKQSVEQAEKPVEKMVEDTVENAVEKPVEKPVENRAEKLPQKPVGEPAKEPAKEVVDVHEEEATPNGVVLEEEGVVTTFEWSSTDAKEVILAGSFNAWKKDLMMTKGDGKFSVDVTLQPGKHFYKFIADGEWCYDFVKPSEADSSGNMNNTIVVAQV